MALPQKHTITANVQVRGGAARVVALENAVKLVCVAGDRSASGAIEVAKKFEEYLSGNDGEDSDEEIG